MADYATHHASVVVNAPLHQVYSMFTHFNDFPKFMSFVKEVTYYDDQRSHWVAEIAGRHEWDAVNENWVPDRQIGWRSINGVENFGKVTFQPTNTNQTQVDVYVNYNPPAGVLGDVAESLGVGGRFDQALQNDLNNFARMVDQAPPGALDPNSSNYLFHEGSAAGKGTTTSRQNETMYDDPRQRAQTEEHRPVMDSDITGRTNEDLYATESDLPPMNTPTSNTGMPGY
jgi:uncharacterized membrane protein